jgi:hypothetical protein
MASSAAVDRGYVDPESARIAARIAELKNEIGQLPSTDRKIWADKALEELARKRQLNAVVTRRAEQGDVLHGMLGATVVRLYAETVYGADWQVEPAKGFRPSAAPMATNA